MEEYFLNMKILLGVINVRLCSTSIRKPSGFNQKFSTNINKKSGLLILKPNYKEVFNMYLEKKSISHFNIFTTAALL